MSAQSEEQFQDIHITGMDENRTHNPDPSRLVYDIYLTLDGLPTYEWSQIFEIERRFPRHSMWRRARVEGRYIVIQAPLEELQEHHIPYLKEDVQNTNGKYREYLRRKNVEDAKQKAAEDAERQRVKDLKDKLRLD